MAKRRKRPRREEKPEEGKSKVIRLPRSIPIDRPPGMHLYWVLALIPVFAPEEELAGVVLLSRLRSAIVKGVYKIKPDRDLVPVLLHESVLEKLEEVIKSEETAVEDPGPAGVAPEEKQDEVGLSGEEKG